VHRSIESPFFDIFGNVVFVHHTILDISPAPAEASNRHSYLYSSSLAGQTAGSRFSMRTPRVKNGLSLLSRHSYAKYTLKMAARRVGFRKMIDRRRSPGRATFRRHHFGHRSWSYGNTSVSYFQLKLCDDRLYGLNQRIALASGIATICGRSRARTRGHVLTLLLCAMQPINNANDSVLVLLLEFAIYKERVDLIRGMRKLTLSDTPRYPSRQRLGFPQLD
jgi:hypothetical protein